MNITIDGGVVRIKGDHDVDLRISYTKDRQKDVFCLSLCYGGFERGVLPMIEIPAKDTVIVYNTLEKGRQLLER